ncbi:uncharacterized protein [Eurosta solidaginis]|uniref:uncharacterized protein n=1 Tax=Eurosta solidaginis TaxID=178769 RepID=UPI003530FE30
MAMYYYASKISAIACGTRCRKSVLQKSRGQRDRDKYVACDDDDINASGNNGCGGGGSSDGSGADDGDNDIGCSVVSGKGIFDDGATGMGIYTTGTENALVEAMAASAAAAAATTTTGDGIRHRRRHSEQLDAYDLELGFHKFEVSLAKSTQQTAFTGYGVSSANMDGEIVQYDIPKNSYKRANSDINYESSVLGSGGIMYINGRIASGPLDSLIEVLVPKNRIDFDKEFIFSFLLSSRLFLRPHELLGKLLSSVPESESLESLVALLAEWTQKFPYDYRDEQMMSHVKHIVARCSNTNLEGVVSEILSALLKQLTDLERHEEDLRACQSTNEKPELSNLDCPTASHYAQILCRLEKKLAKQIGPEEFLQCSSNILLDKQKKWDQPSMSGGPPGVQDPKKTCNLETYLDWSARLRLFVCNEILQSIGIRDRSKTVELWSGVAQYCLLVGNYNSATAILETLESPPIARLKITWSKLQTTCQQLDCMQRHAEGHSDLWHKQASILNESHQKTDACNTAANEVISTTNGATGLIVSNRTPPKTTTKFMTTDNLTSINGTTMTLEPQVTTTTPINSTQIVCVVGDTVTPVLVQGIPMSMKTVNSTCVSDGKAPAIVANAECIQAIEATATILTASATTEIKSTTIYNGNAGNTSSNTSTTSSSGSGGAQGGASRKIITSPTTTSIQETSGNITTTAATTGMCGGIGNVSATAKATAATKVTKPNDWVVIPVFADIVKLALAGREDCLQRLPNGHINIVAFDRMAAIVGAFTKHMHSVKSPNEAPPGEYKIFCQHMQRSSKLSETELMMASFDCEEPNNAEKLMYDLN